MFCVIVQVPVKFEVESVIISGDPVNTLEGNNMVEGLCGPLSNDSAVDTFSEPSRNDIPVDFDGSYASIPCLRTPTDYLSAVTFQGEFSLG